MVGDESVDETQWYRLDVADAFRQLKSDLQDGLNEADAARRLEQYGPNALAERSGRGPLRILGEQFSGAMVIMLIVAAVVSWFLGEYKDAIAILTIVVLNAILGFVQDFRAERAMAALKQLAVPTVTFVARARFKNDPRGIWFPATWCCWKRAISCRRIVEYRRR